MTRKPTMTLPAPTPSLLRALGVLLVCLTVQGATRERGELRKRLTLPALLSENT